MSEKKKEGKTGQVEPSVVAPVAGVAMPSIEDRVGALETSFAQLKDFVNTGFTDLKAKLDTLIQVQSPAAAPPAPAVPPAVVATQNAKKTEAEWDTEYVNNLPDSAFAYIESGGEKDEEGKTRPRSLRHFEYKNMEGNLDRKHIVNGLARLGQDLGDWATDAAKTEIKRKLCSALKEWNSEHEDKIESDVCEVHPETKTEQDPGEGPPKEPKEPPKKGEPKTDKERFIDHYGLTEEQMDQVLEWIGEDVYKLVPERGQKTKTEQMSAEEIKARIAELSKQREELMAKLYPEAELTEEERADLQAQLSVIGSELEALEQALGQKIAEGQEGKTERVIAAVKPVEPEENLIVLTEKEIYDVMKDKRRFTPALQVNGILDLLEQKRKEAEA